MLLGCSLLQCCGKFLYQTTTLTQGVSGSAHWGWLNRGPLLSDPGRGETFPKTPLLQSSVRLVCSCWTWWSCSCVKLNKFKSFNRTSRFILNIHQIGVNKSLVSCSDLSCTVSWGTWFLWDSSTACLNRLLQDNPVSNWRSKQGVREVLGPFTAQGIDWHHCWAEWDPPLLLWVVWGAPQGPPSLTALHCPETGAFLGTGRSCQSCENTWRAAREAALLSHSSVSCVCHAQMCVLLPAQLQSRKVPACPRQSAPAPRLSNAIEAGPAHHSPEECSLQQYLKSLFSVCFLPFSSLSIQSPTASVPFVGPVLFHSLAQSGGSLISYNLVKL